MLMNRAEGASQARQRQEGEHDLFPEQNLDARQDQENPNTLPLLDLGEAGFPIVWEGISSCSIGIFMGK